MPTFSLAQLSTQLLAELKGDPNCEIHGIAALDKAQPGQISFLHNPHYRNFLKSTLASAVILSPKNAELYSGNCLIMENPYLGYAKVATLLAPQPIVKTGIHTTAIIGKNCQIAPSASIGAYCVIGDQVKIGENTILQAGCILGDKSTVGNHCLIYPRVTFYAAVRVGHHAIIHSGVVLGSDGFGMVNHKGEWYKIPQLGSVSIGDFVEIGANTTIDRGALEDTIIESGVKLDNLIQVAHNVCIGAHTAIAAGTLIGGSTQIGAYCMIGGGATISDHITIVDHVMICGEAQITHSLLETGIYSSALPAGKNHQWNKNIIRLNKLDELFRRVKKLEARNQTI